MLPRPTDRPTDDRPVPPQLGKLSSLSVKPSSRRNLPIAPLSVSQLSSPALGRAPTPLDGRRIDKPRPRLPYCCTCRRWVRAWIWRDGRRPAERTKSPTPLSKQGRRRSDLSPTAASEDRLIDRLAGPVAAFFHPSLPSSGSRRRRRRRRRRSTFFSDDFEQWRAAACLLLLCSGVVASLVTSQPASQLVVVASLPPSPGPSLAPPYPDHLSANVVELLNTNDDLINHHVQPAANS